MNDLAALLPHAKKDAKLDTKSKLYYLNELADLYNCNNVLFFESRKHGKDLYLWLSKAPNGPSMKLHLQNRKCVYIVFANCSPYDVHVSRKLC
jgi:ribosome biogenesis protein BRX1